MIRLACIIALTTLLIRDNGQWAQTDPETKKWIEDLKNKQGKSCCNSADGYDVQWDIKDGRYRIFVRGKWYDVPPEAVLDIPNRLGVARAWYSPIWGSWKPGGQDVITINIHCFLPGPGT